MSLIIQPKKAEKKLVIRQKVDLTCQQIQIQPTPDGGLAFVLVAVLPKGKLRREAFSGLALMTTPEQQSACLAEVLGMIDLPPVQIQIQLNSEALVQDVADG